MEAVTRLVVEAIAALIMVGGLVGVLIRALIMPWWRPSYAAVQIPTSSRRIAA